MKLGSHDGIGITAHYTALGWALLGRPEAHRFVTWQGRALRALAWPVEASARRLVGGDLVSLLLEPRSRIFEARLGEAAASGCRCFVELGAGLSPRGVAYSRDPGVTYVEVDLPPMSARKRRIVGVGGEPPYDPRGADHGPGLRLVGGDALDAGLYDRLAVDLNKAPVAVVAEGLVPYLTRPDAALLTRNVARFLRRVGGGVLLFDTVPAAALRRTRGYGPLVARLISILIRGRVGLPIADDEDGLQLLRDAGFDSVRVHRPEPHEHPASLRRRPPPTPIAVFEATIGAPGRRGS